MIQTTCGEEMAVVDVDLNILAVRCFSPLVPLNTAEAIISIYRMQKRFTGFVGISLRNYETLERYPLASVNLSDT